MSVGSTFWRASSTAATPASRRRHRGYLSHLDYSEEADKLLFLASARAVDESEGGDVWTLDADGDDPTLVADGPYAHPVVVARRHRYRLPRSSTAAAGEEVLTRVVAQGRRHRTNLIVPDPPPGEVGIPVWGTR